LRLEGGPPLAGYGFFPWNGFLIALLIFFLSSSVAAVVVVWAYFASLASPD